MAKGHGGVRPGAGRKPKDEEERSKRLSVAALVDAYGSEEAAFLHAAKRSMEDDRSAIQYFKLLIEYAYGKPKETHDHNIRTEQPLFGE